VLFRPADCSRVNNRVESLRVFLTGLLVRTRQAIARASCNVYVRLSRVPIGHPPCLVVYPVKDNGKVCLSHPMRSVGGVLISLAYAA